MTASKRLTPNAERSGRALSSLALAPRIQRETRQTTLLLIARLSSEGRDGLCRVRNISSGGMRIETATPMRDGQQVRIELKNGTVAHGCIMWTKGHESGLRFDHPVDVADMLGPGLCSDTSGTMPRAPRLSAGCTVTMRHQGCERTGQLQNISQSGARIRIESGSATTGDIVLLTIPGLEPHHVTVRWIGDGSIGLSFVEPLSFATLADWLASAQRFGED